MTLQTIGIKFRNLLYKTLSNCGIAGTWNNWQSVCVIGWNGNPKTSIDQTLKL